MSVGRITFAAPWTADETRHGYDRVIRSAKRDPVALVQVAGWDKRSATANANLIAAAPELLAALKAFMLAIDDAHFDISKCVGNAAELLVIADAQRLAIAAIAKAEGRQE